MRSRLATALTLVISLTALAAYAQQTRNPDLTGPLTPELAEKLSQNVNRPVIVLMRNKVQGALAERDQADLMNELHQVGAQHIKPFRITNAFAATVSDGELARLKANPRVEAVAPDVVLHRAIRAHHELATKGAATAGGLNTLPGSCSRNILT